MRLIIFILCICLYSCLLKAASNPLLECLAKEEEQIHKDKTQGVLYRLNQELINQLASSNDISLKKKFVEEICQSKKRSPSVALLRLLLIQENDLYDFSLKDADSSLKTYKMAHLNEFQKEVPRIFIQYISGLQSGLPTFDCLPKAIPELVSFNERLKYLEEEISIHEIIKDKSKINKIFDKLLELDVIKKNCEKESALILRKKMEKKPGPNL